MAALPQPAPAILELGGDFYDPVEPADFPQTILRFRNDRAAATIGLDGLNDAEWIRHFGRFTPLPDNLPEPLALRYHGHQFRVYNPDIGDGRGFLFAQLRDGDGRLLDLGTKGSGQTPYSRFGDGRLTLKGGVRELLATEMVEALGVDTSRTFSLIETGEPLERGDEPSPTRSAVLVRLQHSHIRIGTFQRLATLGEADNLRKLTAYCLRHYYADDSGDPAMLLGHDGPGRPPRRLLHRRRFRPRRAQFGQYRDHRAELRLRPVALDALLGRPLHRRLFRSCRPLQLRPPARGDPLGPRPARAVPARDRGGRASDGSAGALPGPVPARAARRPVRQARPAPGRARRGYEARRGDRGGAGEEDGDHRPLLLRLARRTRAGGRL